MLEQLSLEKAMRMTQAHAIAVISKRSLDIREYVLQKYIGFSAEQNCHLFQVLTSSDGEGGERSVRVLTDVELGLRGDAATARFAELERSAACLDRPSPTSRRHIQVPG